MQRVLKTQLLQAAAYFRVESADDVENVDEDEDNGWIVFNTGVKG